MPSTFHPFSALPTELRLRVWKDVIRPDLPAVHILLSHVPGSHVPVRPQDTIRFPRHPAYQRLLHPDDFVAIPL